MSNLTKPSVDGKLISRKSREKQAEKSTEKGRELIKAGKITEAIDFFERVLAVSDNDAYVLAEYAKAMRDARRYREAEALFVQALAKEPRCVSIIFNSAMCFVLQKNYKQSFYYFDLALEIEPNNGKFLSAYANNLAKFGDYKKSNELFEQSLKINKNNIITLNSYASSLIMQEKCERAFDLFEQSLKINPNNIITLNSYATALLQKGGYDRACQLFEQSLQLDDKKISTLYQYANALLQQEEIERAYQLFEKALLLNPKNVSILDDYANALLQQGEIERAYQLFEKALMLNPKNITNLNNYANALFKKGEIKRAYQLFEKLLELDPKDVKSLNSYANALLQQGEIKKAYQLFEKLLKLDSKDVKSLNSYANALLQNGETDRACLLFEKSLQLDNKNIITLNNYANALFKKGEIKRAYQLFEKLLELDPKDVKSLNSYANALLQQGEIKKAYQLFEKLLKLDSKDVKSLNSYANALLQNGEIERACLLFEQSLQLDDKNVITLDYHSYVCLQYSKKLESQGKYQDALSQLLAIDLNSQKNYHANIIRLHLGRLYYRLHQHNLGKQYFEEAIAHSNEEEKDQSLFYAARSLLAVSPHSEEAVSWLQQIKESSLRYEEAMKAIALNADPETAYELFAESEESFGDAEMLYRSIYHKIGNEVAILKSIAQRLLRKIAGEHPIVAEIVQDLDDLQESVTRQRTIEKAKIAAIPRQDYPQLIEIVSQTAHNISDEVNNILAAIESKTRRALRKLKIEDPLQENFQKLLLQLELTQTALNDLKSINEGIAIRRHRFPVRKLFEKWQPENWSNTPRIQRARIQLKIENPDSEFDGDEEKIKSILNELVENSLKHNYKHPDLLIRIISNDLLNPSDIAMPTIPGDRKYLYLQVIDNGQGVPDDKKEWIFQPLNTTSPEDKGSGLGLFIARKTLQKMRGYIREVGEFGKGAKFQIYIPYLSSQEF